MKTITETLLSQLNDTDDGIKCSALVSKEGWLFAFSAQQPSDEDDVSSLSAAIFAISKISIARLAGGAIKKITIEGDNSQILILALDQDLFLTTFTQKGIDPQVIFEQMSHFENDYVCLNDFDIFKTSGATAPASQIQQPAYPSLQLH